MNTKLKIIVIQVLRASGVIKEKLDAKFPEIAESIFCTDRFDLALKEINPDDNVFIITGNFLKTETKGLKKNADEVVREARKINKNAKIFLYSSEPHACSSDFDGYYEKEGAGDYECTGLIDIFYDLKFAEKPKERKVPFWKKLFS